MSTTKRILRPIARPSAASAAPPSPSTPPKAAAPRRVIPLRPVKAEPVKQPAPRPAAPVDSDGDSGPKVDYAAVVAKYKAKVTNRSSAIRAHCVECSNGVLSEVRKCTVTKCALYPFRNGEDPFRKKRSDGFAAKNQDQTEGEDE